MITFNQLMELLAEAKNTNETYKDWGTMHEGGTIVSGLKHKTAKYHDGLRGHTGNDSSLTKKKYEHHVDYAQEHIRGDKSTGRKGVHTLNIRTHTKHSLKNAIDNFHKLPHVDTGHVTLDHCFGVDKEGSVKGRSTKAGSRKSVLAHMKKLYADYPKKYK